MLADLSLPPESALVRATPKFDVDTVPAGLLNAHRVASNTWGFLCVREGSVKFVLEDTDTSRLVEAGQTQVIQPDIPHRVEVKPEARFVVEFHR